MPLFDSHVPFSDCEICLTVNNNTKGTKIKIEAASPEEAAKVLKEFVLAFEGKYPDLFSHKKKVTGWFNIPIEFISSSLVKGGSTSRDLIALILHRIDSIERKLDSIECTIDKEFKIIPTIVRETVVKIVTFFMVVITFIITIIKTFSAT